MSAEASQRKAGEGRLVDRFGAVLGHIKAEGNVQQPPYPSPSDDVLHGLVEGSEPSIQEIQIQFSRRTTRLLWMVAIADMVAVAWMIAAGGWFDQTSRLTSVVTLGGHHALVLTMALVGFLMLAGLALPTKGFTVKRDEALLTIACFISIAALAGALSVILPVAIIVFLLIFKDLIRR
jgi:hypothetical protein